MNTSRPTIAHRAAQMRTRGYANLQQQRQQPLPTWLADRTRRRTLAVAVPTAILTLGAVAALSADALGWIFMILVPFLGVAGALTLRRAVHALDVAPTALLDEREISQRDRGYREAFRLTTVLAFALYLLATINNLVTSSATDALLTANGWSCLTLASFFTVVSLPAAALTWRWQPSTDEQDQ